MAGESATVWRVAGARVVGAVHRRVNKPGQDAILWKEGKDFVVLAVADGHGSERSPHSDVGARLAVEGAVQLLSDFCTRAISSSTSLRNWKQYAEDQLPQKLVQDWIERVEAKAGVSESETRSKEEILLQYGSTLLAALVTPEFLLFVQLGDGDILTVMDDSTVTRLIPKGKRLIANETTSLCMPYAWREMEVVFQPVSAELPALILLSTDGYANSFASDNDFLQVGKDYLDLIRQQGLKQVAEYLEKWLTEASDSGSGDDIAVGLIYRDESLHPAAADTAIPDVVPDEKPLASGSLDRTVRLWDAATGQLVRTLAGHTHWVRSVALAPDGQLLASGSDDTTIRLWDVATGQLVRTLEGHTAGVKSVAFSPDGRLLASGGWDTTVRLWDATTGQLVRTLKGHTDSVFSVAFSPDGRLLASGSLDNTVRLWGIAPWSQR